MFIVDLMLKLLFFQQAGASQYAPDALNGQCIPICASSSEEHGFQLWPDSGRLFFIPIQQFRTVQVTQLITMTTIT